MNDNKKPIMIKREDFKQLLKTLPPDRARLAELAARVWDGEQRLRTLIEFLASFYRNEEILRYLLKENLTGRKLWDWMREEQGGSVMRVVQFVMMKLDKDLELKPIVFGKDLPH